MKLLAALSLLKGLSYVQSATSAFLIGAWFWVGHSSLLILSAIFLAAALLLGRVYQRLHTRSLAAMIAALAATTGRRSLPDVARSAAQLLFMEGRDDEARRLLTEHFD